MVSLSITNNNLFMNQLLKNTLFDKFQVREVTLHTSYKIHLDGSRNQDFYNDEELENLSKYLSWSELRPSIFELIKGNKTPTYFKIVLSTSPEYTQKISNEVSTFFLNITFKEGQTTCVTGTAYSSFSLDKSPEKTWDDKITQFLILNKLV
ncbi:MAG: hypothetical protein GX366_07595 [Epulopiscium sp.]|nr:hypothetical protein [Candidatus Epulonipiscium sp.]